MFKNNRVEDGTKDQWLKFTVGEDSVLIKGTGDFVIQIFKAICESEEFAAFVRKSLNGATREEVAAAMRKQGFPETVCATLRTELFGTI
jgi:hypothetical protein